MNELRELLSVSHTWKSPAASALAAGAALPGSLCTQGLQWAQRGRAFPVCCFLEKAVPVLSLCNGHRGVFPMCCFAAAAQAAPSSQPCSGLLHCWAQHLGQLWPHLNPSALWVPSPCRGGDTGKTQCWGHCLRALENFFKQTKWNIQL